MQDRLNQAIQLHTSGQLEAAAALYRQVLQHNPEHADALQLLGVIHLQRKELAAAIGLLSRAVALRPEAAEYYVNLAEAYRAAGQADLAIKSCKEALRLRPGLAQATHNLALAERETTERARTIEQLQRQLEMQPDAALHTRLAGLLRQLDRKEDALHHFRRAAELTPSDAIAQANVAQMLLSVNRVEEALPYCRRAVQLKPDIPVLRLILGDALRLAERFDEARAAYLEAARLQPNLARAHANLGLLLRAQKRTDEAFAPLKKALALEPGNSQFWKHLADTFADSEDFHEALRCWKKALELQPLDPAMRLGLASALLETGQAQEAETHLRCVERLQPESPDAQLVLAKFHEQRGELDQAEAAYRAAMRLQPDQTRAACLLTRLLGKRLPDADLAAMEKRLADGQLFDAMRAGLLFALAAVMDAREDYARAAHYAKEANAISLKLGARRDPYSPELHRQFVEDLIRAFGVDFFTRTKEAGIATQRPVFVVGLPRSGTTLVEQILASHPRVYGAGELRLAQHSFMAIPAALGHAVDPVVSAASLNAPEVRRLAEQHLAWLAARGPLNAERIVDKMPGNYQFLGLLAAMFPRATFIHCRRDLRDVAVSCWLTEFQWLAWTNDFSHISTRFADYLRLMDHWREVLPVTLHEVKYENLVDDLETGARRLIEACGLDWNPACLEFHRTSRPVRTASALQVRQPLYRRAAGRWKNYEHELAELFTCLPREFS